MRRLSPDGRNVAHSAESNAIVSLATRAEQRWNVTL
jgi:hypothetical protein